MTPGSTATDLLPDHGTGQGAFSWTAGTLPGCGVLAVERKRSAVGYVVVETPTDWSGRAFHLEKLPGADGDDPGAESYDLFLTPDLRACRCECRGFLRWGHCKHLDALAACVANGWL